jgi:hypothetical protein
MPDALLSDPRWTCASARNHRIALESLFGWTHVGDLDRLEW